MSAIDQAEPVVESMIGRGGIAAPVNRHAEMPLAKVSGTEAFAFQDLGECRFTPKEMHFVTLFTEDGIDSGADVVTASEKSGTGRRADRRPGVEVSEAHAFGSQRVENRCIDWPPVTANVAVAEVVNEEGDNIRWFSFALCSGKRLSILFLRWPRHAVIFVLSRIASGLCFFVFW